MRDVVTISDALAEVKRLRSENQALGEAFAAIAAAVADGAGEWQYPGQVVRDVERVVRERDVATDALAYAEGASHDGERLEASLAIVRSVRGAAQAEVARLREEGLAVTPEATRMRLALLGLVQAVHQEDTINERVVAAMQAGRRAIAGEDPPRVPGPLADALRAAWKRAAAEPNDDRRRYELAEWALRYGRELVDIVEAVEIDHEMSIAAEEDDAGVKQWWKLPATKAALDRLRGKAADGG